MSRRLSSLLIPTAILAAACAMPAVAGHPEEAGARLEREIQGAIDADGPWLTDSEQAMIRRECGYDDDWDGDNVNISDGVLVCSNGRRVDKPEVREAMRVASARISRRVNAIMESPSIRAAIDAVASEASREALARLADRWGSRDDD